MNKYINKGEYEVNDLLSAITDVTPFLSNTLKVTDKVIEEAPDLADFKGFTIKTKQDGEHKHDGQSVEYTFTFISPKKEKTVLFTEMNLVAGWNFDGSFKFKL